MTCNQIIAGLTVVKSVYTKVIKPVITVAIKKFKKLSETGVFSEETMVGFDPEEPQVVATTEDTEETTENSEPTKEESKKENLLRKVNTTIKWLAKMATVMSEAVLEACDFLYDLLADVVTAG